jgi:hypothetical protein
MPRRDVGSSGNAQTNTGGIGGGWESSPVAAAEDEAIDPAELREFLSADFVEEKADPAFRERLRSLLWEMVKRRYGSTKEAGED